MYINGLRKRKGVSYEGNHLTKMPTGGWEVVTTIIDLKAVILIIRNLHANLLSIVSQNIGILLAICLLEIKEKHNNNYSVYGQTQAHGFLKAILGDTSAVSVGFIHVNASLI